MWEMEDEVKFVQNYLDMDTRNGVIDVKLPLHGGYAVWFGPKAEKSNPRYGPLPEYEPRWAVFRFTGELEISHKIIVYPIGFIALDMYSPDGKKLTFRGEEDLWKYNMERFAGVSSDSKIIIHYYTLVENGIVAIGVPAGKSSKIIWAAHVPGYGWAWLEADNRGEYYTVGRGEVVRINLVLETSLTMYRLAKQRIDAFKAQGYSLSENVTAMMKQAKILLDEALRSSSSTAAKKSWEALRYILLAEEQAILDRSRQNIERYRMGELHVILPSENYKVNVTLDYPDFFFFVEPYQMVNEYWREIVKIFKFNLFCVSFWETLENGVIPEETIEACFKWINERAGGNVRRILFSGHATGPGYYIDAFIPGEENYYPEHMLRILRPTDEEAVINFSKNWFKSFIKTFRRNHPDVGVVEYITEDELEYRNSLCWSMWNDELLVKPCPLDYKIRWLKEVIKTIREADPNAKIFMSTISAPGNIILNHTREDLDYGWFGRFTSPEAIRYFIENGVDIDGVNVQIHMQSLNGVWDVISLYDLLEGYSKLGISIGILEFQVPSNQSEERDFVPWRDGFSEENQAELLRRALTVMLGNPRVVGICYYTHWFDTMARPWTTTKTPFFYVGLLRADGTPKPAYYALLNFFKSRIYQGEIRLSDGRGSVKTLEGWYYVTISDEDGNVIGSYRIHVDGGSKTYLILHQYENQALKAEVKKLREEIEKSRARISSLKGEIRRLEQDVHEKEALIAKLREQCPEEITKTATTTITTTLTETITLQKDAIWTLETYLLIICIAILIVAITLVIAFLRRGRSM